MDRNEELELRQRLVALRLEHRDLDSKIVDLERSGAADQLRITRLKKLKLQIKDQIAALEDKLFPDIIA